MIGVTTGWYKSDGGAGRFAARQARAERRLADTP